MKKTILLSGIIAIGAASAGEIESGNAIGVLDKAVNKGDYGQVLVSVPFVGYENGGAVKVKDVVKTSGLETGSKLYVADGEGGYNAWKLNDSGEWVADTKVMVVGGQPSAGESASEVDATIGRGDSFWLEPKFGEEASGGVVFLLGQRAAEVGASKIVKGWNLAGNASTEPVSLAGFGGENGDQIIVQSGGGVLRYYVYGEGGAGWRYRKPNMSYSDPDEEPLTIAPGQGFWYKSKSESEKTITWSPAE